MNRYKSVFPALLALAAGQSQYQSGGFGGSSSGGFGGSSGGYEGGASDAAGGSLEETIPGVPGDDYPIFAQVPETSFLCDGQVDGGYYADPEAECQAFHICASDGIGGLTKYSFLCPNGTLFQQQYFVCDWWFNVDCSTTEDFYSLNDEIAAEREANSPGGGLGGYQGGRGGNGGRRGGAGSQAAASANRNTYSAPSGDFGSLGGYARPQRDLELGSYAPNDLNVPAYGEQNQNTIQFETDSENY